jgi:hypothetical protein
VRITYPLSYSFLLSVSRLRNPGFDCPNRWESGKGAGLEPIKTTAKALILFPYFTIKQKNMDWHRKESKNLNKFSTHSYEEGIFRESALTNNT